jgi:NADH-quinone oxidoreductase subunit L
MPITYATVLIGAISSAGIPGFAGFFSKESIIEAAHLSSIPGATFAYCCVAACVFVTAFYTFRLVFMTFHGRERFRDAHPGHGEHEAHGHDSHGHDAHEPHESPAVVTIPLIALAIPSICAGWIIGWVLYGNYFGNAIVVAPQHDVLAHMAKDFHGVLGLMAHAPFTLPFWLALAGIATAYYLYMMRPDLPAVIATRFSVIYRILDRKYGFDELYSFLFAGGARTLGTGLWKGGDVGVIDGTVNGSARLVGFFAALMRRMQSGYIYHYAFAMIFGILVLLTLMVVGL